MSTLPEAVELFMAGRLDEARRACRKALRARADLVEAHVLLAEIHRRLGDATGAREAIERVIRLRPSWNEARVHYLVGELLLEFGRTAEAEERFRCALELDAALVDARMRLVRLLADERRFVELEAACREAMALHPESPQFPARLGTALWRQGREAEALDAFRLAVERAGAPGGESYDEMKLQEATTLLALGRPAEGWRAYRWRYTKSRLRPKYPQLVEDPGEIRALASPRHIRIVAEQGLGDEIFFLRFAVALRARGHRLSVDCEPKLAGLLGALPLLFDSVNAGGAADFVLASGDLPFASGQDLAPPLELAVDAQRRAELEARLRRFGPPPYIAVTWASGLLKDDPKPSSGWYLVKAAPVRQLGEALRGVDARIVSLQRKPEASDIAEIRRALGRDLLDLSAVNDDLADALAALSLVDDYVCVSNTNTYLRAALPGQPARVLVRTPPEWRWYGTGSASPWFPRFEVYRQSPDHDWPVVLNRLGRNLANIYGAAQQN